MQTLLTADLFADAPAAPALQAITLQGPVDLLGFRSAARALLARQVPPEQVSWHSSDAPVQDLFAPPEQAQDSAGAPTAPAVNDCCGGWCMSPHCAMTRSTPTRCWPGTWRRPCAATCTR